MVHIVKQGEHISTIAAEYGFLDSEIIWKDPANAALRTKRQDNPNVLNPGDQIVIPDKVPKTVSLPTGKRHIFEIKLPTLNLIIILRDVNGKPIPNCPCELEINDKVAKLTADGDGKLEREIPISTKSGKVTARGIEYPFLIGHLDPIDTESGQLARLSNLGYYLGHSADDPAEFKSAVEEFQCDYGLTVDGDCGPNTQKKLKEVHGS